MKHYNNCFLLLSIAYLPSNCSHKANIISSKKLILAINFFYLDLLLWITNSTKTLVKIHCGGAQRSSVDNT